MSKKKKLRQFKEPVIAKEKILPIPITEKKIAGRPSDYETKVKPFLEHIKYWVSMGLSNKEIYTKLDIGHDTFCTYQNTISEFSEAIKSNRVQASKKIKEALEGRAVGYYKDEFKESEEEYWAIDKETKIPYRILDETGSPVIIRKKEKFTKHIPADPKSASFLLVNTDKENWKLGNNTSINVNNQNNNVIQNNLNLNELSDDDLELELKKLE